MPLCIRLWFMIYVERIYTLRIYFPTFILRSPVFSNLKHTEKDQTSEKFIILKGYNLITCTLKQVHMYLAPSFEVL